MRMRHATLQPLEILRRHWRLLLIASLPGSALRIWAALAPAAPDAAWGSGIATAVLLIVPGLAMAGVVTCEALGIALPAWRAARAPGSPRTVQPPRLDAMTAAARELLVAASPRGELRLVPRHAGTAVVAGGTGAAEAREFYDPIDRSVTQRYRQALAELERAGLVERDGDTRRLSALGWPAARLLTRQELDRLALRARHLAEPEQRLLRLIADCRARYRVDKVVVRRDGSAMGAVFGNGQTVPAEGPSPRAAVLPGEDGPSAAARFEALVAAIPADYLEALPERRLGNPFVLRLTDNGLRYLRYTETVSSAAA